MFCFQCQETSKGTGCQFGGVCGKRPETASKMDMLLFITRGVSVVSTALRDHHVIVPKEVDAFVTDALFSTITNANFDDNAFLFKIQQGFGWREQLLCLAARNQVTIPPVEEAIWRGPISSYPEKAHTVGVLRTQDEDIRSLKETITYGLKGMAAYLEHARNLDYYDEKLDAFIQRTLSDLTTQQMYIDELLGLVLETGNRGVQAMALLDKANTSNYGNPRATKVSIEVGTCPGILVTGHDLFDLEQLLLQSTGRCVDIYTHGEMLPAHYYPLLQQYPNLKGNYGNAWWRQKEEFEAFNGPILFTSNCLVPIPETAAYRSRVFTTNSAGFPNCKHISPDCNGIKDFRPIIEMAKHCAPPQALEHGSITGGYAHDQLSQLIDPIIDALNKGHIKKFVVLAGCDGRHSSRGYYTEYAEQLPHDTIILTAGCAKYRFNKLDLGEIDGIPRVLDAGQCNDSYSLVLFAIALCEKLGLKSINDLPIYFNLAWYEQKAVIVLLALLSLGVKDFQLGPTLPAFLSPKVREVLGQKFAMKAPEIAVGR